MSDTPNTPEPQPACRRSRASRGRHARRPRAAPSGRRRRDHCPADHSLILLLLLVGGGGAAAWFLYLPSHPIPALARFLPHPTPAPGTPSAAPAAEVRRRGGRRANPARAASSGRARASAETAASSSAAAIAMSSEPTASASAAPPVGAPTAASPQLQQESAGLLVDARRYGLPGDQVGSLAAANGRLNAAGA